MSRDFFDPTPEEQVIILVSETQLRAALQQVTGCEACSTAAELPFDNVLDSVTGCDPSVTDYMLEALATCLWCGKPITEKTLVDWDRP